VTAYESRDILLGNPLIEDRPKICAARRSVPPMIMLTGDGRESTVIKALRMGMDDYLPKRDLKAVTLI
jgi:DNA-binding NarL/FixJ family response regulator